MKAPRSPRRYEYALSRVDITRLSRLYYVTVFAKTVRID
jgi:hypothetical protein